MWTDRIRSILRNCSAVVAGAALVAVGMTASQEVRAQQPETVKIAVIVPISGAWARQGTLVRFGAETAVEEINASGGIKALGGAKIELVVMDAGDSAETAKNAAQRLVAQEPDVVGGMGSWLSTFTLAVTEVTERASVPWLTLSYADTITDRGFNYVFQTSPTAGTQAVQAVPTIMELAKSVTGEAPKTAGIIADNTASPVSFLKPMREGGLEKLGVKVLHDQVYTPPLSDATPLIQRVRSQRPEFLLFISTTISDLKLGLEKLNEFRLGKGAVPVIANGAHMGAPEVLKNVPADVLEGLLFIVANWQLKGQDKIADLYKSQTKEPWITQDGLAGYGHTWILKEAMERTASTDRAKIAEEIRKMDLQEGPAALAFPGGVKFEANGRRAAAPVVIAQWQSGVPVSVSPADRAFAQPIWPKN